MKKHIKIYLSYFNDTYIPCEICVRPATDIHHIKYKSRGGKDEICNLMALCRDCHNLAHDEILKENDLQRIHNDRIKSKGIECK